MKYKRHVVLFLVIVLTTVICGRIRESETITGPVELAYGFVVLSVLSTVESLSPVYGRWSVSGRLFEALARWGMRPRARRVVRGPVVRPRSSRLTLPPGVHLRGWLSLTFGRRAMDTVFDPLLGDVCSEWAECVGRGQRWQARVVRVRGYVQVLVSALVYTLSSLFDLADKVRKTTRS